MSKDKVVVGGSSEVMASQLKDLFRQFEDRSITGPMLQALLEHRNPFTGIEERYRFRFVRTVNIPATRRFIAKDCFRADISSRVDGARIVSLGPTFEKRFLGKREDYIAAAKLKAYDLLRPSLDASIIPLLGGHHETSLAHLWALLELERKSMELEQKSGKQVNNENRLLRYSGHMNIFYIRDTEEVFWTLEVTWGSAPYGLRIEAVSVWQEFEWPAGTRVFAC